MKRKWILIKELLLRIECLEPGHHLSPQPLAEHCANSVKYHLHLMHQAGLIECSMEQSWEGESELIAHHLTQHGHHLLDGTRDNDARQHLLHERSVSTARKGLRQTA